MTPQHDTTTYLLLEGHQGHNALDGWRRLDARNLQITSEGVGLAPLPSSPTPLTDAAGTFGGLEQPTGVAVAPDGAIYISDRQKHTIFKLVRREGWQVWAYFFLVGNNRYVYVPTANRLERWKGALETPADFAEVEVLCENIWHESQMLRLSRSGVRRLVFQDIDAEIEQEWEEPYPTHFPAGDTCKTTITYLPCLGGLGSKPRQFNEPRGLAISRDNTLYVADTQNHRIQVFALRGLVLKAIWGRRLAPQAGNAAGEFNAPWDVAVDTSGNVYIADTGNSRLQKYDCRTKRFFAIDGTVLRAHLFQALYGPDAGARFVFIPRHRRVERWSPDGSIHRLSQAVDSLDAAGRLIRETIGAVGAKDLFVEWEADYPHETDPHFERPTHLALDAAGRLYVVDEAKDYVKILDSDGRVLEHVRYAEEVSDGFRPTALVVDAEGKLVLADRAAIYRLHRETGRYCCDSGKVIRRHHCEGMAIDAKGHLITSGSESGSLASIPPNGGFETRGVLYSQPLDSRIDQCQWHKIRLDFGEGIPPGTSVTVWTYTANDKLPAEEILALDDRDWLTGQTNAKDFLILSLPGRYLWLKIEFRGNGVETPVLRHLQAFFPRLTCMEYLPAVYQAEPVSKDFLERFLSIFDAIFSGIEEKIDNMAQYFDPYGVPSAPGKDFLAWLATWIDMTLDPRWPLAIRRQLLEKAPELYRQRGTVAGLKKLLKLALGVDVQVLEHFQLRRWLFLSRQSTLGGDSQLWGNGIVSRLQLEEHSRIGDFALVGTGDPQRDPFHVYAHKFSVFVPASRCSSEIDERKIRGLIDSEKPAHTEYTLCSVEARFRVGMQSTVGFDTMVGAYPRLVLNRSATLGYDTLLGRAPEEEGPPTIKVGERSRVGVNAVVG